MMKKKANELIDDDDFIVKYQDLKKLYDSMYAKENLKDILKLPANQMKNIVDSLPDGIKDTLKSLAVTCIETGEIDSVRIIKAIDEIFGTQMLLKLTS